MTSEIKAVRDELADWLDRYRPIAVLKAGGAVLHDLNALLIEPSRAMTRMLAEDVADFGRAVNAGRSSILSR